MTDQEWYEKIIRSVAMVKRVPDEIAVRQCWAESSFNPSVIHPKTGAIGLFQLMPRTARELDVDPYDPIQNIIGGIEYLRRMRNSFRGDIRLALAAYNWGPGNLGEMLAHHEADWEDHLPMETQNYLKKILDDPPRVA